jgi:hypothetical protein
MHSALIFHFGRSNAPSARNTGQPAEGFELLKDQVGVALGQAPHRAIAALHVSVRDFIELVRHGYNRQRRSAGHGHRQDRAHRRKTRLHTATEIHAGSGQRQVCDRFLLRF